jgi:hypothetical protein
VSKAPALVRVVIAHRNDAVRRATQWLLDEDRRFDVVACVATGEDVVRAAPEADVLGT